MYLWTYTKHGPSCGIGHSRGKIIGGGGGDIIRAEGTSFLEGPQGILPLEIFKYRFSEIAFLHYRRCQQFLTDQNG